MRTFHRLKKEIGNFVLSKHDYKCTECGSTEHLCVHHIIKMEPNNERYNDIDNLTVLCRSCHLSIHRKAKDVVPNIYTPAGNKFGRRGNVPPIRCSIENCDNMQHGKALCKKHYEQKRRKNLI